MTNKELERPEINVVSGKMTVSSLEVAHHFRKRHDNVLQRIEATMESCPEDFSALNFQESSYINEQNKEQPAYDLTRDGFSLLVMGFTGKRAMVWKIRYIEAFSAMEDVLMGKTELDRERQKQFGNCEFEEIKAVVGLARLLAYFDMKKAHVVIEDLCDYLGVARIDDISKRDFTRALKWIGAHFFRFGYTDHTDKLLTAEQFAAIEGILDYQDWQGYKGDFEFSDGQTIQYRKFSQADANKFIVSMFRHLQLPGE